MKKIKHEMWCLNLQNNCKCNDENIEYEVKISRESKTTQNQLWKKWKFYN